RQCRRAVLRVRRHARRDPEWHELGAAQLVQGRRRRRRLLGLLPLVGVAQRGAQRVERRDRDRRPLLPELHGVLLMRRRLLWIAALAAAGWLVGIASRDEATRSPSPSSSPVAKLATPRPAPALAAADTGTLHARPPGEWDGMLVDMSQRQYCEASSYCG